MPSVSNSVGRQSNAESFCCRLGAVTADFDTIERLMRERRSERTFLPDPVSSATLDRILEIAACAPSASNRQPYRFMVVSNNQIREQMVALVRSRLGSEGSSASVCDAQELANYAKNFLAFGAAPCVVVVVFRAANVLREMVSSQPANDELSSVREGLCSASAFIMQLLLATHAEGLGACWMTGPCIVEQELLTLLEIPQGWRLAGLVPVGYVRSRSLAPRKRRADQLRLREPSQDLDARSGTLTGNSELPGGSGCASS